MKKSLGTGHKRITLFLMLCMLLLVAMPAIALAVEEPVPVMGIALDYSELTLTAGGETETLTATVSPADATEQAVTWSSSNEAVVTVADGVVTPLEAGIATITATTADGDFTAACEVTVNAAVVSVTGVTLDHSELILTAGCAPETLTATVSPADATEQAVTWSSSDEAVASVADGVVTPLEAGIATITAATADGDFTAACEVTVNAAVSLPRVSVTGASVDYPLISSSSDQVTVNCAANGDGSYEWYYSEAYSTVGYDAYVAGNSGQTIACVSNISITVSGAGSFSFDYLTSTYGSGDGYALYYKVGEPITQENYNNAANYDRYSSFRGIREWTAEQFNIESQDLDDEGKATVYIAYLRAGTLTGSGSNTVAIANVCFTSGEKTLTLNVEGSEYGSVTDGNSNTYSGASHLLNYNSGDTVALTANVIPETGGRFYGWVDGSGNFLTTDETYSTTISSDTTLKAVFAPVGNYVARRNGMFYTQADGGLAQALTYAQQGDTIVMLENQSLSADATVPAGAKLYIPYSANFDADGNADGVTESGSPYQASTRIATSDKTYRTLMIDSGVTLTVNGTLNIGGVISYPGQYYQGHTSGWHGKIENHGNIIIANEGVLDCWGIITGDGAVIAENGGVVCEPFIVYDFSGGSNTVDLYFDGQSPFKQYAMQNIQSQLVLHFGSRLYARCNLYASSAYNKTDTVFIGEGGLYGLKEGTVVTRTYDGGEYIDTNTDIGKATYVFDGGMNFASLSMPIAGAAISTEDVDFPIPYNWEIVLKDGECGVKGRIKFMPGATLRVESGADLTVSGTLFVLDGLIQSDMSGKYYPTAGELQSKGFSASGKLVVDGAMTVKQGAAFGGIVQTAAEAASPATLAIEAGAVVGSTGLQDGGVGAYDVNTSIFDLPARAYIYDTYKSQYTLKRLYPDRTYLSHDAESWAIGRYNMKYAVNSTREDRSTDIPVVNGNYHKWVTATVPLNEERIGSWYSEGEIYHNISVINKTIYSEEDATRTIVSQGQLDDEIYDGGDLEFTVDITGDGRGYVYRVFYTMGAAEPLELTLDEQGLYTVSDVHDDITITVTSCKLGDAFQDNMVNNKDIVELRKALVNPDILIGFQVLAADTFEDGIINNKDLVELRKLLVGQ